MTPPHWHQSVLELARLRFSELSSTQHSTARLLFIKYGQIYCRLFIDDGTDADEPSAVHCQIWKRIDDLKDTPGEAYAVASMSVWNDRSGNQTLVLSVAGAERNDSNEIRWFQRVSIDPKSGQVTGHECWADDISKKVNALASC